MFLVSEAKDLVLKLEKRTISYLFVSARIRVNDPFSQMKPEHNTILDDADSANHIDFAPSPEGWEGCPPDFKWKGWSNGAKSKPQKNPGPKFNPQKFPSHNSFQKAETVEKQVWFYTSFEELTHRAYAGTTTNLYNYCFNQTTQKTTCQNFRTQKIPISKISNPKNRSIIPVTWNP